MLVAVRRWAGRGARRYGCRGAIDAAGTSRTLLTEKEYNT